MSYPGPAHARVPSSDDTRHHIVQSLFSKTDDNGTAEETLISYVKVYEDDSGPEGMEQKTRYLMLAGEWDLPLHFHPLLRALLWSDLVGWGKRLDVLRSRLDMPYDSEVVLDELWRLLSGSSAYTSDKTRQGRHSQSQAEQ